MIITDNTRKDSLPMPEISMDTLKPGESGLVTRLLLKGRIQKRLLDIGLVEGTRITCIGVSPFGDPAAYLIRGSVFAIRKNNSRLIQLKPLKGNDSL